MYNTHVKYFPYSVGEPVTMATASRNMYIKQVTLDGTIIYFNKANDLWSEVEIYFRCKIKHYLS
jgi:hypothetical protein